jgi:glycosyltransferase involved in cell wall biosynthesis
MKTVSIVIPVYRRTTLLENTLASIIEQYGVKPEVIVVEDRPLDDSAQRLCFRHDIKYFASHKGTGYNNVSTIYNIGIRKATSDIIVMQSAECKYESTDGLQRLVAAIENDELKSVVPLVMSTGPHGGFIEWYNHPSLGARAGWTGFFCHAMHRSQLMKIGGYDEIFKGYGHDDDLLLFRMKSNGIQPRFEENVLVTHQWHPRHQCVPGEDEYNRDRRLEQEAIVNAGGPNVANLGKEWGMLPISIP